MFEANTTLKLNIVMLIIAAGFFGYVLLAPGREPLRSGDSTPFVPASPAPTQLTPQSTEQPVTLTASPSATPATPTLTPTATRSPTPSHTPMPAITVETATPMPTPETMVQHIVAPGEVLSAIAARYGVTVEAIVAANGLADPNRLAVGQVLIIPQPTTPASQ